MTDSTEAIFKGNTQMHALCSQFDWSKTLLGPVPDWSVSLRTTAALVLASTFPSIILWGKARIQIYNDAYMQILGDRHTGRLGEPKQDCWPEIWHISEPICERVWQGESVKIENSLYKLQRSGQLQDAWFTLAYSPVMDDNAQVGGILLTIFETTARILEQKSYEKASADLHQSEQRFKLLIGATSDIIYTMSADWKHMEQLVGKEYLQSSMKLNGRWMEDYIPEADRNRVWSIIQEAIAEKKIFQAEHQVYRRDGSQGWIFSRAIPILDKNSNICQWVGAASDISSRKESVYRQNFLLELTDALRLIQDPELVAVTACRLLVGKLRGSRAQYTKVSQERGNETGTVIGEYVLRGAAMPHQYPLNAFGQQLVSTLCSGNSLIINDTESDPRISVAQRQAFAAVDSPAAIAVPLTKNGSLIATFTIHNDRSRQWTADEILLVEQTAERTWATFERARAEEALRVSEKRLRMATEAAAMATWEWDLINDQVIWNERHFRIFDLQPGASVVDPQSFFDHVHPQDRQRVESQLEAALKKDAEFNTEFRAILADGSERWMSGYGRVMEKQADKPISMSGVMFDITARKQTENDLHRSEARQSAILESAHDYAILTLDMDLKVRDWNGGAEYMMGYSEKEIIGQPGEIFFVSEDRDQGAPELEKTKAIREGRAENERWHLRKNGTRFYGSGITSPLRDQDGNVIGLLKVMRDLTMQQQAADALKEADQRKDQFLAMLAHELRNPLSTVQNGISVLKMIHTADSNTSKITQMMEKQAAYLVRMIDDLLDVSRVTQGKVELRSERVQLGPLITQALGAIQAEFEKRNKKLHLQQPLPELYVHGDETRLSQVITNLLTNGLRYSGENGQVWVALTKAGQQAQISVRDNGIGLSAKQRQTIFDLFVQADNSLARSQGGLGLGLTLVRQLVEMHGGQVRAESAGLGQGSEFKVFLPLLGQHTESGGARQKDEFSTTDVLTILVIDDVEDLAQITSTLLKLNGFKAEYRLSGEQGVETTETLKPSVVLCDIGMPEIDGYQTAHLIRKGLWGKKVILIAVSGYAQQEDKDRAIQAGFDAYLTKPVDINELKNLISNIAAVRKR